MSAIYKKGYRALNCAIGRKTIVSYRARAVWKHSFVTRSVKLHR